MRSIGQRFVAKRRHMEGIKKQALETGRNRLLVAGMVITIAFAGIAGRLTDLAVISGGFEKRIGKVASAEISASGRADIVDRNGVLLATSLPTVSLHADPTLVIDAEEVARKVAHVLPNARTKILMRKLSSNGRFVWLARNLTPKQHHRINSLGLPGISFQSGERRVYPHGQLVSHVLGLTDVDGNGVAGLENSFDGDLRASDRPLRTSIDVRVQSILRDELIASMNEYKAIGAAGLVMDVNNGEILAMVSLPDYDPNKPSRMSFDAVFNRAAKGVYEMGSTFKLFTAAMALDSGVVDIGGGYDASKPIRISRFAISDYHAKNRWLSVPEIILHSSNIGAAKMALDVGGKTQKDYLQRFGLLHPAALEIPEVGSPLLPDAWRLISTMTISYGHGISVSPVQLASGVSALVNGGLYHPPTLLGRLNPQAAGHRGRPAHRVISKETSNQLRGLMRLVVRHGTGRRANVRGYVVGGKTGTAEKSSKHGYSTSAKLSSFVGAFPMNAPQYVVFAVLDEPIGNKNTFNYATGGWVVAPAVGRIIERMAPMVGIPPQLGQEMTTPKISTLDTLAKNKNSAVTRGTSGKRRKVFNQPEQGHAKVAEKPKWADIIARAVAVHLHHQTESEASLVLRARAVLGRAVLARKQHRKLLSTAVSLVE